MEAAPERPVVPVLAVREDMACHCTGGTFPAGILQP